MELLGWIALVTFIAGFVGTGLGGLIGLLLKKNSNKIVSLLLSFAAGMMLAVVCFDLMTEALNPADKEESFSVFLVIAFVVLGYLLVSLLNYFIDKHSNSELRPASKKHPATHDNLDEMIHSDHLEHHRGNNAQLFVAGIIMAAVISLHNLPEGMVIGASYANDTSVVGGSGILIAIVIAIHNIPEGMAVSVPLVAGGMKKPKALLITACSGLPTVIGALLGYALGTLSPLVLSICLSLASGAMLYVVFGELLPEAILMWKSKIPALFLLIGLLAGFVLVLL